MAKVEQLPSGSIGQQVLGKYSPGDNQICVLPADSVYQRTERNGAINSADRSPIPQPWNRHTNLLQHILAVQAVSGGPWMDLPQTLNSGDYFLLCDKLLTGPFQFAQVALQGHSYAGSTRILELFCAAHVDFFGQYMPLFVDPGDFNVGGPLPDTQVAQLHSADSINYYDTFGTLHYRFKTWYIRLPAGPIEITSGSLQLT